MMAAACAVGGIAGAALAEHDVFCQFTEYV